MQVSHSRKAARSSHWPALRPCCSASLLLSPLHYRPASCRRHLLTRALAGEYISVASQKDAEEADIEKERAEQAKGPAAQQRELEELTQIYIGVSGSQRTAQPLQPPPQGAAARHKEQ